MTAGASEDDEMKQWIVECECISRSASIRNRLKRAYGDSLRTVVVVFAGSDPDGAKAAACEKLWEKWMRHQDVDTEWAALSASEG